MATTRGASHQTVKLRLGRHHTPDEGACVMELASMLASERFSDHPKSVCSVVGEYLRTLNDACDDADRQRLYPVAAIVVGSRVGRRARAARRRLCEQRLLEIRGTSRHRFERFFVRANGTQTAATCAAAFVHANRFDDAMTFVDELLAIGAADAGHHHHRDGAGHGGARMPRASAASTLRS